MDAKKNKNTDAVKQLMEISKEIFIRSKKALKEDSLSLKECLTLAAEVQKNMSMGTISDGIKILIKKIEENENS